MTSTESMADLAMRLITSISPDTPVSTDKLRNTASKLASRVASNEGGTRKEWADVRRSLQGLSRFANIKVQDDVSSAYNKIISQLEEHRRRGGLVWDERLPLQTSNLPQHVQLLLELARPTSDKTQEVAEEMLQRPPRGAQLDPLFREIMSEPFTGEHWGPGYDEEVHEGWTDSEDDDSFTASDEEIVTPVPPPSQSRSGPSAARQIEAERRAAAEQRLLLAKLALREMSEDAYWKTGGSVIPSSGELRGWQSLSAIPALSSPAFEVTEHQRAISAGQLQRELLFCLTGRPGVMCSFADDGTCCIRRDHPAVSAFSPLALKSILSKFANHATQTAKLRIFVEKAGQPTASSSTSCLPLGHETIEAFGEACRAVLYELAVWVATLEADLTGSAPLAKLNRGSSTPLQLDRELVDRFGDIFSYLCDLSTQVSSPTLLLNSIHAAIQSPITRKIRPGLMNVFIQSASPMWRFIGDWIIKGMPVPESFLSEEADLALQDLDDERALPSEFFIQRDRDSAWCDEDFWEAGFVVGADGWPTWIVSAQKEIMEGGKARGLLRSMPSEQGDEEHWASLSDLLKPDTEDIELILTEYITPVCERAQKLLGKVLEWDCGLSEHLNAVDGLSLMRAHDVMESWADHLFLQMRSGKAWADFHLLTHSIRDLIESHHAEWMNPQAVRVRTARRSKATLSDIRVDYMVPFPLSQVFTATSMDLRSDSFTFMLRLMRARKAVQSARSLGQDEPTRDRRALFLRLHHGLSWFLSTLWNWINNVIDICIKVERNTISKGITFHDLVNLELNHARKLRTFCFLHADNEEAFHHVERLMDMADELYMIANVGTVSSAADAPKRPQRRRSRQVDMEDSDDPDNDDTNWKDLAEQRSTSVTISRPEDVAESINLHVRKLRRMIDDLAAQAGAPADIRELWGMLAFVLGDWKEI